jgi:hypothetical protein
MATRKREPWHPLPITDEAADAAGAMERGDASATQQRIFVDWLLQASGVRDEIFVADNERVTSFLAGRRSIGLQFAALLKHRPRPKTGG